MFLNLAPWYYRKLLGENSIIEGIEFFEIELLNSMHQFESSILLKSHLRPPWLSHSKLYRNTDGSGTATYKNVAIYKGISEALERWAFYETVDTEKKKFKYDVNPTTTGMAAYPHFNSSMARLNAKSEAIERWAIHEFNQFHLPVIKHPSNIKNLNYYEIITPFNGIVVSLLEYWNGNYYCYGFAASTNHKHSFKKALVELGRNLIVLNKTIGKVEKVEDLQATVDRTLFFFSTIEGNLVFNELINKSPKSIFNEKPNIICDLEVKGPWSDYARIWRYLLADSYFDCRDNYRFFMF